MNAFGGFRVGRVHDVVLVQSQPAAPAELVVLADELPVLRQDLDAMVVAIGDDQSPFRIELERMRRSELAGPGSRLTDGSDESSVLIEDRDASHEVGIGYVR